MNSSNSSSNNSNGNREKHVPINILKLMVCSSESWPWISADGLSLDLNCFGSLDYTLMNLDLS